MKKLLIFFTTLFLSCYFNSIAQETIEYDFATNKLNRPQIVKEGASVIIQYKGVNKFALKSSASMTSGNRSYDDGLSQLQEGLLKLATEKKKAEDKKEETDNALAAPVAPLAAPVRISLTAMQSYLDVKAIKLANIQTEFNNIYQEVLKINGIMSIDKDIIAATNDPTLNSQALIDATIFIQVGTTGVASPADFTSGLAGCVNNISISVATIVVLINGLTDNFTNANLTAAQRQEEGPKLDELISELKKRVTTIDAAYSGQNLKTLQDNASDMGRRSLKLLSQDFIVAPTIIGNADGDYIEISDKLTDNDGKQILEINPFKINTYGGSRIDFSLGLSVIIGGQGKYKYDLRKNPTNATKGTAMDSVILLSNDEDRLFKFSPTIFVHWYKNSEKMKTQWMLTTGLTPNFADLDDSRLSIGTSLGLPSSNNVTRRLVLSGGISVGYADVLKTKYKGLADYRSFGDLDAAELTDKALKVGAFFSISYNLGGVGH